MLDRLLTFFADNVPPWRVVAIAAPLGLLWAVAGLALAGWLKQRRGWATPYTRKVFHFLTFFTAAACLIVPGWGLPVLCVYGGMTSLVVFYALLRGRGHRLYEALARERDEPHRSLYIIFSYLATLLGGLISHIYLGPAALAGLLVTGLADALAEPVGVRFGRHRYRVLTLSSTRCERSLEGSLAVFLASLACVTAAALLSPAIGYSPALWWAAPVIALCCALVEAVSPHGWDNLTLQVAPSALVMMWLS